MCLKASVTTAFGSSEPFNFGRVLSVQSLHRVYRLSDITCTLYVCRLYRSIKAIVKGVGITVLQHIESRCGVQTKT